MLCVLPCVEIWPLTPVPQGQHEDAPRMHGTDTHAQMLEMLGAQVDVTPMKV